jgi:hypothetical protein
MHSRAAARNPDLNTTKATRMNIHKRLPMRAMGWPTEINKGQYCDDI